MPDPIPITSKTRRTIPTREVTTDWGLVYATCTHPDQVAFSTNQTVRGGESSLFINRVRYEFRATFTRGEIPERERSRYDRIDDTWHSESTWSSYLQRYMERGDATENAGTVLREHVLPQLGRWLRSPETRDLLHEGDVYWRAECQHHADAAERSLSAAFQKVQELRSALAAGRRISDDEVQFLKEPHLDRDRR